MGTDTDHINPCFGLCFFDSIKAEPLCRTAVLWMYSRKRSHHPNLCRRRPRDRVLFFFLFWRLFLLLFHLSKFLCLCFSSTNKQTNGSWPNLNRPVIVSASSHGAGLFVSILLLDLTSSLCSLSVYPIPPMLWKQPGM